MTVDVTVTASVQQRPKEGSNYPAIGPYPFNYEALAQKDPFTHTLEVLPTDTFAGVQKVVDIPAHLLTTQNFLLIKTDLPVKVRVRDTAGSPITFERELRTNGSIMVGGGAPSVDQISFEGVAGALPCAKVTVMVIGE